MKLQAKSLAVSVNTPVLLSAQIDVEYAAEPSLGPDLRGIETSALLAEHVVLIVFISVTTML